MGVPAVFMDRDGTINDEMGYINHISRFKLLPRSAAAIRLINQNSFKTVIITNQSGVGRGYFPEKLVEEIHDNLKRGLSQEGAHIDGIYYCPHHPFLGMGKYKKDCECRKPKIGMIKKAAKELDIDLSRSYMVGDRGADIQMAKEFGGKGVLVLTGYGKGEYEYLNHTWPKKPDYIAEDLYDAVEWILRDAKKQD
ncbi:MAG TPA: HAD family hydrolase [Nitrospinota bacterium]|nr:HAD family hydrolase [Nitrospinota bacterium]